MSPSGGGEDPHPRPSRRGALAALGLAGIASVAGCSDGTARAWAQPRVARTLDGDGRAQAAAIARSRHLRTSALAQRGDGPRTTALLALVAGHHLRHLAALGDLDGAPVPGPPPLLAPRPPATPAPAMPVDLPGLARAEAAAATEALAALAGTGAGMATLLARIAAARAVHARVLAAAGRGSSPVEAPGLPAARLTTREGAAGLPALVAGTEAAVYAYGLVAGRGSAATRALALACWEALSEESASLRARLRDVDLEPPPGPGAYEVPAPATASDAVRLAVAVETALARTAAATVGTTAGPARGIAATALVAGARRLAGWGATPALPGG